MTDKPSDILARAADILMERGWVQEKYEKDGKVCLAQAIAHATIEGMCGSIITSADRYVQDIVGCIEDFNDASDTTFDMVLGALHDAQLAAKEAGQ